jgi:hypothetical protein
MDIPMKARKRWQKKDVQQAQKQERAQATAARDTPPDAQRGRQNQGVGVPAGRRPSAARTRER